MTKNKRVLITGGTGKVGRSFVKGFASEGWEVILTSRSQERAEAFANECQLSTGALIHGIAAEFGCPEGISLFVEQLKEKDLLPDCLINNVRNLNNLRLDEQGKPSIDGWVQEFYLGVVVAYELAMSLSLAPQSRLQSVINIASMYGVVAPTLQLYNNPVVESPIHYGVCKAAVIHLTRELAVRIAYKGIRFNAISYGGIEGRTSKDFIEKYAALCPQRRMLNDTDVFGPALFLATEASSGVTGHNLVVDGGWSIW